MREKPESSSCCAHLEGALQTLDTLQREFDYLINGPLPDLREVVQSHDKDGLKRWCRQFKRHDRDSRLKEAMELAVERGDLNARMPGGSTALHEAVLLQLDDIVEALVEAGSSTDTYDSMGRTALDRAHAVGNRASVAVLQRARSSSETSQIIGGLELMKKVKAFKRLDPAEFAAMVSAMSSRDYKPGEAVFREGEVGRQMFIIQTGKATVKVRDQDTGECRAVATLGPGEYFGERSLLLNEPRSATVEATIPLKVYILDYVEFSALDLAKKVKFRGFRARRAVRESAATQDAYASRGVVPKDEAERKFIVDAILANQNLGPLISHLSRKDLDMIASTATRVNIEKGVQVVAQHDTKADHFFIVQEGELEVLVDGDCKATLGPGASFGELALIYRAPRAATVSSTSDVSLWTIFRTGLKVLNRVHLEDKLDLYTEMLGKVDLFVECTEERRREAADALVEMTFFKDEYIIKQGDVGDTFYLLCSGQVRVEKDGEILANLIEGGNGQATVFGERALLTDERRAASIIAASDKVVACAMTRNVFRTLRQRDEHGNNNISLEVFVRQVSAESDDYERQVSGASVSSANNVCYNLDKLLQLGVLGAGAFGIVTLVKDPETGQSFALKALSKGHIIETEAERTVLNEKWVMRLIRSPFVVRLCATFNRKDHLYFLIEPAMGGTLHNAYQQDDLYGSQEHALFYIACVLRALEHIHKLHVIYRDLKPENLLLDARGYCKVTDFGLSKITLGHSFTACGTPEYFAPEMVKSTGHTKAVDWWTLGVLLFELETSEVPFQGDNPPAIFANVLKGIEACAFPPCTESGDEHWQHLVKSLCKTEASERLPMRPGGVTNVEGCAWYADNEFDWPGLNMRRRQPPFTPPQAIVKDGLVDLPPQIPYIDPGTNWDADFEDPYGPARLDYELEPLEPLKEEPETKEVRFVAEGLKEDLADLSNMWQRDASPCMGDEAAPRSQTDSGEVVADESPNTRTNAVARQIDLEDLYGDTAFSFDVHRAPEDVPRSKPEGIDASTREEPVEFEVLPMVQPMATPTVNDVIEKQTRLLEDLYEDASFFHNKAFWDASKPCAVQEKNASEMNGFDVAEETDVDLLCLGNSGADLRIEQTGVEGLQREVPLQSDRESSVDVDVEQSYDPKYLSARYEASLEQQDEPTLGEQILFEKVTDAADSYESAASQQDRIGMSRGSVDQPNLSSNQLTNLYTPSDAMTQQVAKVNGGHIQIQEVANGLDGQLEHSQPLPSALPSKRAAETSPQRRYSPRTTLLPGRKLGDSRIVQAPELLASTVTPRRFTTPKLSPLTNSRATAQPHSGPMLTSLRPGRADARDISPQQAVGDAGSGSVTSSARSFPISLGSNVAGPSASRSPYSSQRQIILPKTTSASGSYPVGAPTSQVPYFRHSSAPKNAGSGYHVAAQFPQSSRVELSPQPPSQTRSQQSYSNSGHLSQPGVPNIHSVSAHQLFSPRLTSEFRPQTSLDRSQSRDPIVQPLISPSMTSQSSPRPFFSSPATAFRVLPAETQHVSMSSRWASPRATPSQVSSGSMRIPSQARQAGI